MPVVQTITIPPGGGTGWHYHPGRVDVVVLSGTLTRTLHDGRVEVSRAGDTLVEEAGPRYVHAGCNHGGVPVVLIASYDIPEGCPLAVPVPEPDPAGGCPAAAGRGDGGGAGRPHGGPSPTGVGGPAPTGA
ncbi:cupin domain-containing protein [Kitasatospora sp. NPDC004240]